MSMKKWTDEELASTCDKLEVWNLDHKKKGWAPRLWILTALMGAFAISTGVVFIFLDGMDVLSVILIVLGSVTCFSWYQSEKKKKETIIFYLDYTIYTIISCCYLFSCIQFILSQKN